jgi:hypothetical protein
MLGRVIACALVLLAAGCTRDSNGNSDSVAARAARQQAATAQGAAAGVQRSGAIAAMSIPARAGQGFARLPDHGQLLAYPGNVVRRQGAYTWHRADLSEAYALRAIRDGHLQVTTPGGQALDFKYDRHVEHASGDWTWIGHRVGHELEQAVLTFGATAAFGSIAQPDKHPLRLTVRDGVSWLVETDTAKLADVIGKMTRKPDFLLASRPRRSGLAAQGAAAMPSAATTQAATVTGNPLVDVVLGYTPGFAADNGGNSGAVTQLNFLVDFGNTAYSNSKLSGRMRLVAAIPVNYPDNTSNNDTLEKLSGYQASTNKFITPDPAFNALRAARETYGADLVSLVRKFQTPENENCGIAWLLGGSKQGIDLTSGWDQLGYSVVSDGTDYDETELGNFYCEDHTLAHELGHNMGLAHDRETSKGDDGILDNPDDYGVYDYSFGYKTGIGSAGFYDVMAYGDTDQYSNNIFSNPSVVTCGYNANQRCGIAIGQADAADASTSLKQTMPIIAAFRATKVAIVRKVRHDFNTDGKSDLLWRDISSGVDTIWKSANSATRQTVATVATVWKIVGAGDFNGDGAADILWRNSSTGANAIWKSGNAATPQSVTAVTSQAWAVMGVGDFDGDGAADILWRNTGSGANAIWKSGNSATPQAISAVTSLSWKIVGVGDFNADGKSDILWRNTSTGANVIWKSGNPATSQTVTTLASQAWTIAGIGDFDGNGTDDIVWRNTSTGANAIWKSGNSATPQVVSALALAWKPATVGDYDSNGKSDLVWRNSSTGANAIWLSANSATSQPVTGVSVLSWVIIR